MLKNLRKKINEKKKKKGFTLIELIIVIAIIAILAAVALPKFGQIRENANRKADISNAKNIHTALTVAYQQNPDLLSDDIITPALDDDLKGFVEKWEKGKSKDYTVDFGANVDDQGNVHIYLSEKEVYPNTDEVFTVS